MIEEKEELQGQLIASGQIVGSIVGCKGEKGDPGEQGSPGVPGQDGFSPIASISKTGKVATITITDSQGTTTAEIRDGEDGLGSGDMLKATYDTNNNGVVDNAEKVNNHTVLSDVPSDAVFTDTTYTAGTNVSISAQNVISATDTTYTAGTGIEITAGNVINNTQTSAEWGNISGDIDDQTDLQNILDDKVNSSDLSTVATSGSYNDLSNKPTIPTKVSDLTNDSGFITNSVNNLTNYTTTSTLNTLLAGKEKDIPIQNTAPENPEEDDLWIDTSEPEEMQEAIVNEYSESTSNTYSCDYVNGIKPDILNGVFLYSNAGLTTASITSKNGYGRCILISSSGIFSIQFQGTNTTPTIVDFFGTHSFTASVSGNVVTLSNLANWDHYIFLGSSVITNIE